MCQRPGQLLHLRIIGNGRSHQSHLGRLFRPLPDILQQQIQIPAARFAEAVARHTEPAMPPTAPGHFHNEHVGKFCIRGNNGRCMRVSIQIPYPLAGSRGRYVSQFFHACKGFLRIIFRFIKLRHIYPRQLRRRQQFFPACLLIQPQLSQKLQQAGQRFLPFPDDHHIRKGCQRFRIKGSAGTAQNHKGIPLSTLFGQQFYMAHLQLGQDIQIIHFKRDCYTNIGKICQRALGLHGKQRRFGFRVFRPLFRFRQEETLAGPALCIQDLVQDVKAQI